mmetsp:Transcript_7985/g.20533  ORF Transcript_7985/g.20533 Transcript_7985/m.20533 type:complete len:104 (-) Transcript_7985:388-699(-)
MRCAGPGNSVLRPRTLAERRAVAARAVHALGFARSTLVAEPPLEMWLDDTDDAFSEAFAAWPIRLFGLRDGEVRFIAQPVGGMYDLGELDGWLDEQLAVPHIK